MLRSLVTPLGGMSLARAFLVDAILLSVIFGLQPKVATGTPGALSFKVCGNRPPERRLRRNRESAARGQSD